MSQADQSFFDRETEPSGPATPAAEELLSQAEWSGLVRGYLPTEAQMAAWDLGRPQRGE